jgi:hypothetical protein
MKTEFEVTGYRITALIEGGEHFSEQSVSFIAEKDGVSFPLKTKFDNELIRDLCCIMGLDPVKELENIAIAEITEELSETRRHPQEVGKHRPQRGKARKRVGKAAITMHTP